MHIDHVRSNADLDLALGQVIFRNWPSMVILYIIRLAVMRGIEWYQEQSSNSIRSRARANNVDRELFIHWPVMTSILTWVKNRLIWFQPNFWWAFQRRSPFSAILLRSRLRRGCSNIPPPPGRSWIGGPPGRLLRNWRGESTLNNAVFWPPRSQTHRYHERSLHSPKVTAWCAMSVQVGIGPFWYEDTDGAALFITAKKRRSLRTRGVRLIGLCFCYTVLGSF